MNTFRQRPMRTAAAIAFVLAIGWWIHPGVAAALVVTIAADRARCRLQARPPGASDA